MADNAVVPAAPDLVTVTVDDVEVSVPKGTLVIRAAEQAGIVIPRFCDHPLLDPVGACRQCLVEIPDAGNGRGFPMPQPSCTTVAADGMQVKTAASGDRAKAAQEGMLELLLVNHPLDCPVCDKGGECPLQNQAIANGQLETRFDGVKRQFPKVKDISPQIVLDRERCVLCTRCTRFADQIAGDPLISLAERSTKTQVGLWDEQPFMSYFSGNVVQICPVGALTATSYRFSSRPFDLVSAVVTCEGCAAGCQLRADQRHGQVRRRLAGELPEVNEEWSCDRGRFGFVSGHGDDRLTGPLVRRDGELRPASWPEALEAAVAGLRQSGAKTGVLTGGRLTREAAYAYARFAHEVLGTRDIDCRARPLSAEETAFLPHLVIHSLGATVTYADLEKAKRVVLVGFEPEDEAPMVFLRLRKAVRRNKLQVTVIGALRSAGSAKLNATLVPTLPGREAAALAGLEVAEGTIVLGGERLASSPGALKALEGVAARGGRWAWVPRRPGELGALQAGAYPTGAGRDTLAQLAALSAGQLDGVIVAGLELADLPDPAAAAAALDQAGFVLSVEQRLSDAARHAHVVLPVALLEETSGTFVNWEWRASPSAQVTRPRSPMTEIRVLAALADDLDHPLGFRSPDEAAASLGRHPAKPVPTPVHAAEPDAVADGAILLATWRELLDDARLIDGQASLIACARPVAARLHPATAKRLGLAGAQRVRLSPVGGPAGAGLVFDLICDPTLVEGAVWAPSRARGSNLAAAGLALGQPVNVTKEA